MLPTPDSPRGPELELDWELGIFTALRGLWRRIARTVAPKSKAPSGARVDEDPERWRIFASLLAGRPLSLRVAHSAGGIRGDALSIPPLAITGDAELDRALLLVRVAIDATTVSRRPQTGDACEASRSVEELSATLPQFAAAWAEALAVAHRHAPDSGPLGPEGLLWGRVLDFDPPPVDADTTPGEDEAPPAEGASEAEARMADELKVLSLGDEEERELPLHAFEKVEMLEPFRGVMRQLDGEDELSDHLDALEEVDLGHLVRGGPQAHSVLRADIALDAEVPDVHHFAADEEGIAYDEWDGRKRRWRPAWCRVYPSAISGGDDAWAVAALSRHRQLVERLHGAMLAHRHERLLRRRQTDGDDVDIDALTDAMANIRAGRDPGDRLYTRRPRERRDLATTVLIDLSLSSDSWVDDRRVLDISREAVLVLGEVAERLGDRVQVLAFASHTRHKVRVWHVCDWQDPWRLGRARLGLLKPQGYTRIGPALRYATDQLAQAAARERLLLLISDGKPTDYDRYEGRYGMADVRMALRQARDQGVRVHALAVDRVARQTLPVMMGPGGWDVLSHPDRLPEALTRAWGRAG